MISIRSFLTLSVVLILSIFFSPSEATAQRHPAEYELGQQHYQDKEYDKALFYFKKLFDKQPQKAYYDPLIACYLALEEYGDAEKLLKKLHKKSPRNYTYAVDYGHVLQLVDKEDKAEDVFKSTIKSLPADHRAVIELASNFQRRNELEYAIKTYLKGRKMMGSGYPFNFELAQLYYQRGDIESMIEEYLDILAISPGYLQNVQNALQTTLFPDPEGENTAELRTQLVKRIQKDPDYTIYSDMLIWYHIQNADFGGAFVQARAMDRRSGNYGHKILNLGDLSRSNRDYETAEECYRYLIGKGSSSPHYMNAKMLLVETLNEKITNSDYSQDDLEMLEQLYLTSLEEIGSNYATVRLQFGLAQLLAFYLDRAQDAIVRLENILELPQVSPENRAQCKLLLGDIYLSVDQIWDASLLYSQVEKDFKFDQMGEDAKFKNAKISYYTGDFLWAKAQLDVLKGSTSKLIANDAMRLSLLISDNTAFDTTTTALRKFAKADLLMAQQQLDEALTILDTLHRIFPANTIVDEVLYRRYEIYYHKKDYEKAKVQLEEIMRQHPLDILADDAVYRLAELHLNQLGNKEEAMELYKKLISNYPASIWVNEARTQFRTLRGDSIN